MWNIQIRLQIKLAEKFIFSVVFIMYALITSITVNAEEPKIVNLSGSNLAWGRTYFFDSPRYKDNNIQELLNELISKKLKSFGITIEKGNLESEYLFNYTILLGEETGKSGFEKGKILFSIRDRKTNSPVWRSEIKGLAELDNNENRKQRAEMYLDQAFESFPQEYRYIQ